MIDEMIILAESPEEAQDKFEQQIDADTIKIQKIYEKDVQQLIFPFLEEESA